MTEKSEIQKRIEKVAEIIEPLLEEHGSFVIREAIIYSHLYPLANHKKGGVKK